MSAAPTPFALRGDLITLEALIKATDLAGLGQLSRAVIADGAVTMIDDRLSISDGAEFLVRSVASAFDAHLVNSAATHSRAV